MSGPTFPPEQHFGEVYATWVGLALASADHNPEGWDTLIEGADLGEMVATGAVVTNQLAAYLVALAGITAELVGDRAGASLVRAAHTVLNERPEAVREPARAFLADIAHNIAMGR